MVRYSLDSGCFVSSSPHRRSQYCCRFPEVRNRAQMCLFHHWQPQICARTMYASGRPYWDVCVSCARARSRFFADACPLRCCVKHVLLGEPVSQAQRLGSAYGSPRARICARVTVAVRPYARAAPSALTRDAARVRPRGLSGSTLFSYFKLIHLLILLAGIPDVSQARHRMEIIMSIIGGSEVGGEVSGQADMLASCTFLVSPDGQGRS